MTTELKQHYLKRVRLRYHSGSKTQKSLILDEFCEVCSISRKHAIRLMNEDLRENPVWPGRRRVYGADVDRHLRHLWECMGCLLYTSPSPRDKSSSRMPSSA